MDSPSNQDTTVPALSVSETVVSRKKSRLLSLPKRDSFVVGSESGSSIDGRVGESTVTHVGLPDGPSTDQSEVSQANETKPKPAQFSTMQFAFAGVVSTLVLASISWFLLSSEEEQTTTASPPASGPTAQATNSSETGPTIDPGSDITVGPKGDFQSITSAIDYVQEHFRPMQPDDVRTIRVSGGRTYAERIVIDNSQFGSFPKGVQIICEDEQPAILQPEGPEPIVDLRTVERFHLKGFHLKGTGQATVLHLEGYLVSTMLTNLTIEGASEIAVRGVGVSGFTDGDHFQMTNVTVRSSGSTETAIRLEPGQTPTKEIVLRNCRLIGEFTTGVAISGGASGIEIAQCIVDGSRTSIRMTDPPELLESVTIANCTLRAFEQGISVQRRLTPQDGPLLLTKILFLDAEGPEMTAQEAPQEGRLLSSFNWSDRPTPETPSQGEVDLFQNSGRRGANVSVTSTDPSTPNTYLQPNSAELQESSTAAPAPLPYIGAVAPAGE